MLGGRARCTCRRILARRLGVGGLALVLAVPLLSGCVVVPKSKRRYLAKRSMQPVVNALEARALRKLRTAREGASGGDGRPAGGGCACAN